MFVQNGLQVSITVFSTLYYLIVCTKFKSQQDIVIAGLFPMSESIKEGEIGRGVRPAVDLALKMINNDSNILPEHHLTLVANDTQVRNALTLSSLSF